jgi:prepilin-type N-terminal cleavage/methylation domain-containing protein/prepilin-type processing-associated H-X9-DG protein
MITQFSVRNVVSGIRKAFTLVELLVVIAIIGVLAALLMTGVSRAKEKARRVECLNHLRQLQLAYLSYTDDNQQRLPRNGCRPDVNGDWRSVSNAWCGPSAAPIDADFKAIKSGVLFPYVVNERVYHCPSDTSIIKPTVAGETPLRTRSYALNGCLRGYTNEWYRMVSSMSEITAPASVLSFIDEHEISIDDGHFMIHLPPSAMLPNLPSLRHGASTPVSFLDGHCEPIAFGDDAQVLQQYTIQREE